MVAPNGGRDWRFLENVLSHNILLKLEATFPPNHEEIADSIGWKRDVKRNFSIRSAYLVASNNVAGDAYVGEQWSTQIMCCVAAF
ncbi:hypothetical protein GOBAR_AA38627 [Gossypium barbadense]|uniref:Uncharacterized protein n=1 Tax=Gossypium barbadense TaxID=3634 RepID=A0A2P5VTC1_GOSBA|nr:hypothetical protein GOBAR_AA38627 [Gossypium barbadense]